MNPEISEFARKFSAPSGIMELMDDMGRAVDDAARLGTEISMLGGGNPASIPEVNAFWRQAMNELMSRGDEFERTIASYDTPQGRQEFLEAIAFLLHEQCGWDVDAHNIAVSNGSQSAFFSLFNAFAGQFPDGSFRKVLFPLMPEYIGYADQSVYAEDLEGLPATINNVGPNRFRYHLDLDRFQQRLVEHDKLGGKDLGALCVTRPTNPSGNVLTDEEIRTIADTTRCRNIPFFLDSAYGLPFPGIVFDQATPRWEKHMVVSLSLSKLGLPGLRTGIVVADKPLIKTLSSINAVVNLASGSFGPALTARAFRSGAILELVKAYVTPFYQKKRALALQLLDKSLGASGVPYRIHESGGAFFLWIWLPGFKAGTRALYETLKASGTLIIPGAAFFFGLDEADAAWGITHGNECFRMSFASPDSDLERGIKTIGTVLKRMGS